MFLFKYVDSTNAVLNMAMGSLKFSPIQELNDPTELAPAMDRQTVQDSLELLRKNGISQEQFKWLGCQNAILRLLSPEEMVLQVPGTLALANQILKSVVYEDIDYLQRKLNATVQNIRGRVGVLSLSQRYSSLPMWAHYANAAKGFVVVLENLEQSFKGDETGSLNIPKPVVYSNEYLGMTFDPVTQDRLFFSKLSDWSYEKEWRVVTALSDCDLSSDNRLYLRKVNHLHVVGVICGWRATQCDISMLASKLKTLNPGAKLISAVPEMDGTVSLSPPCQWRKCE